MRPHFLLDRAGGGARRRPSSPVRAELREPRLALLQLRAEHEAAAALCLKVGLRSCRAAERRGAAAARRAQEGFSYSDPNPNPNPNPNPSPSHSVRGAGRRTAQWSCGGRAGAP